MTTRKGKNTTAEGEDMKRLQNYQTGGEGGEADAVRSAPRAGDLLGRHRLSAAIARLHREIEYLQGELEELDTLDPASTACEEVFLGMESISDALVPITKGPNNIAWDRWFQRVHGSRRSHSSSGHRWWMRRSSDLS